MHRPRDYPLDPVLAVGGVLMDEGRILLVQRGQPPSKYLWSLPGGKVELGESLAAAVQREMLEETGLQVQVGGLAAHFEVIEPDEQRAIRYHYVIMDFWVIAYHGSMQAGDDVLDVAWFDLQDLNRPEIQPSIPELVHKLTR